MQEFFFPIAMLFEAETSNFFFWTVDLVCACVFYTVLINTARLISDQSPYIYAEQRTYP